MHNLEFLARLSKAKGEEFSEKDVKIISENLFPDSVEFHDIGSAKIAIWRDDVDNWIYDKNTSTLIVNLPYATHENILSMLYQYYVYGVDGIRGWFMDESAELYLKTGLGFYLSSIRGYGKPKATKSDNYIMSAQEKMVFVGTEFHNLNMRGERL
jgi:hypothetical protein